jgi:tetratricopeptide (TPR) repeat protein
MAREFDANLESVKRLTGSGAHQQALRLLDRMVETFPERYEAYELRSSVNRKMGNLEASIGDLDHVIRLMPNSATPHFRKGRYLCAMHLFGDAAHAFTKSIELDSG